jgi:hypothetical protein
MDYAKTAWFSNEVLFYLMKTKRIEFVQETFFYWIFKANTTKKYINN